MQIVYQVWTKQWGESLQIVQFQTSIKLSLWNTEDASSCSLLHFYKFSSYIKCVYFSLQDQARPPPYYNISISHLYHQLCYFLLVISSVYIIYRAIPVQHISLIKITFPYRLSCFHLPPAFVHSQNASLCLPDILILFWSHFQHDFPHLICQR